MLWQVPHLKLLSEVRNLRTKYHRYAFERCARFGTPHQAPGGQFRSGTGDPSSQFLTRITIALELKCALVDNVKRFSVFLARWKSERKREDLDICEVQCARRSADSLFSLSCEIPLEFSVDGPSDLSGTMASKISSVSSWKSGDCQSLADCLVKCC